MSVDTDVFRDILVDCYCFERAFGVVTGMKAVCITAELWRTPRRPYVGSATSIPSAVISIALKDAKDFRCPG